MFIRTLATICFLLLGVGCGTMRTSYQPDTGQGGYQVNDVDGVHKAAIFSGNAYTHPTYALAFSQLRAVEVCAESGKKYARIDDVKDLSQKQQVLRTQSYNYQTPQSFSGSGHTGLYGYSTISGETSGGSTIGNSTSWQETLTFPIIATVFQCADTNLVLGIETRDISADDMKPYVKDLMGAVQALSVSPDSPNYNIIKGGDIIVKINGVRAQTTLDFTKMISLVKDKEKIELVVFREGVQTNVVVKAKDDTKRMIEYNNAILQAACAQHDTNNRPICAARRKPAGQ